MNINLFNKKEFNKKRNTCLESLFTCKNKLKSTFCLDY